MTWTGAVRTDTYTSSREGRQRVEKTERGRQDGVGVTTAVPSGVEEDEVSISRWPSARMPYMKYRDTSSSKSKREFRGTRYLGERESLSTLSTRQRQ
eukprot:1337750-Prymnesium_polylepis.1